MSVSAFVSAVWSSRRRLVSLAIFISSASVLGGGCRGRRGQTIVSGGESSSDKRMWSLEGWLKLSYGAERRAVWLVCAAKGRCRW